MDTLTLITNSPLATFNLGRRLGKKLQAGSIIALTGELGCGKTLLTRGIGAGLGVPDRRVNSPTFVLVNEYSGRLPVFHMDLYRLGSVAEGFEIAVLDYLARARMGVMIVEWAEKILSVLPDSYLLVQLRVLAPGKREITLSAIGQQFTGLLEELGNKR